MFWRKKQRQPERADGAGVGPVQPAPPVALPDLAEEQRPSVSTVPVAERARPAMPAKPLTIAGNFTLPDARRGAPEAEQAAAVFGKITSILMRSAPLDLLPLADLRWLVVPPIAAGSYAIVDAKAQESGASTPAAVVLWASVSAEVDRRLVSEVADPIRLAPAEWQSGSIIWLVQAVGEPQALKTLLEHLRHGRWKGQAVKYRVEAPDGRGTLGLMDCRERA